MRVRRILHQNLECVSYELLDDGGRAVPEVSAFLRHLGARGCSPNTAAAYAYDLLHFTRFLTQHGVAYREFRSAHALALLEYLRQLPSRRASQRLGLVLCTTDQGRAITGLSATTVNRILAAVSSFYEYLIVADEFAQENPIQRRLDPALARAPERPRAFLEGVTRQRPIRRVVRVKTVQHLPRPLSEEQIDGLLASLQRWRDKAMVLLMLQGGLRPGEVLNLHIEDIQYGRRRVVVRYRTDHPKMVRTKSRNERLVDLHEPAALAAVSKYVMEERPREADSSFLFLVGGRGRKRFEPLSYQALAKLFARQWERLGIREPWMTPHALRHTHATRMWEGGMRELALQRRLGHASPESTRIYTRVAAPVVVAEYRRALGMAEENQQ